jgi:hypothetical protein
MANAFSFGAEAALITGDGNGLSLGLQRILWKRAQAFFWLIAAQACGRALNKG